MTLYKGSHSLFRVLAPDYRLNKAEFIQMYNLRPTTQVMLELIIEEVSFVLFYSTLFYAILFYSIPFYCTRIFVSNCVTNTTNRQTNGSRKTSCKTSSRASRGCSTKRNQVFQTASRTPICLGSIISCWGLRGRRGGRDGGGTGEMMR